MTDSITKKQHYVPQLLLRRFAIEERINVYDITRNQLRRNQSIKNVCAGNYTYDKDNAVETFLNKLIEGPVADELEKLANSRFKVSAVPNSTLLKFLLVQLARTRQAYLGNIDFINSMMQTVFIELARLNGLDTAAASRIRLVPNEPREILSYISIYATTQFQLLADLSVSIIINDTNEEFILSDHPIFQHNWYLRDSNELLASSITARGIQFFVPISPSVTCCLYDSSIYAYRSRSQCGVITASLEDVQILNSFQAINSESLLMAKSDSMSETLQALGARYANSQAFTASTAYTPAVPTGDGTHLRSTHIVQKRQTRVPAMPSFIKIRNKIRRRPIECVHRCPDVVYAHELRDQQLGLRKNTNFNYNNTRNF